MVLALAFLEIMYKPSPFKGLQWAWAWLQISEARAWGSSPGFDILQSGMLMHDQNGKVITSLFKKINLR